MILSNVFFSGMLFGSITGNYDDDGSTTCVSESFFVICRVGQISIAPSTPPISAARLCRSRLCISVCVSVRTRFNLFLLSQRQHTENRYYTGIKTRLYPFQRRNAGSSILKCILFNTILVIYILYVKSFVLLDV